MNKGYTLIELLAILFILGIITIVTVPNLITTNKKSKEKEINEFKKTVENAAEIYVETHLDLEEIKQLKENNKPLCINIKKLIIDSEKGAGLLSPETINPETNTTLSNLNASVQVTKNNGEIIYKYQSNSCN